MMSRMNVGLALGFMAISMLLIGAGKAVKTDVCCATDGVKKVESSAKAAPALVCTLDATGQREAQGEVLDRMMIHAKSVTEKTDGFVISFADGHAGEIVEYVERERACCRFFTFDLHFPAEGGAVSLRISGPDGAKDFLEGMVSTWRESVDATD